MSSETTISSEILGVRVEVSHAAIPFLHLSNHPKFQDALTPVKHAPQTDALHQDILFAHLVRMRDLYHGNTMRILG